MVAEPGARVYADQSFQQYRKLVQVTMPAESFAAFQLAFLRPFAVPRMASLLLRAGSVSSDAEMRAYRTGLQMYEVIEGGLDSPRARKVISHINRAHAAHSISDRDFQYVLDAFIVVPLRHMEEFGWRKPLDHERQAAVEFYTALGRRMAIEAPARTFDEAADRFDAYEQMNVAVSKETLELGELTLDVLRRRLPRQVQPYAGALFSAQLSDDRVGRALGLPPSSRVLRTLMRPALRTHGVQTSLRHRRRPFFAPGQPAKPFPEGYELSDIL